MARVMKRSLIETVASGTGHKTGEFGYALGGLRFGIAQIVKSLTCTNAIPARRCGAEVLISRF